MQLPEGEDFNDWIAVHGTIDSFLFDICKWVLPYWFDIENRIFFVNIPWKSNYLPLFSAIINPEGWVRILFLNWFYYFAVVDFFNRINLIYGTISDFCTDESCPTMSGGARFEYLWADGVKYKKPTKLSAPQYVNLLMDWVEEQINNEELFPVSTSWCLYSVTDCMC